MLRVVAVSIVVAVLGVLYILANPYDSGVKAFGWFLVILGSAIAALLTAVWARAQLQGPSSDKAKDAGRGQDRGRRRA